MKGQWICLSTTLLLNRLTETPSFMVWVNVALLVSGGKHPSWLYLFGFPLCCIKISVAVQLTEQAYWKWPKEQKTTQGLGLKSKHVGGGGVWEVKHSSGPSHNLGEGWLRVLSWTIGWVMRGSPLTERTLPPETTTLWAPTMQETDVYAEYVHVFVCKTEKVWEHTSKSNNYHSSYRLSSQCHFKCISIV